MNTRLIYINLDGFARYYYDSFPGGAAQLPALHALLKEGTFFQHAYTGIPSITFPMQCAILSGCSSANTRNCYQYWDQQQGKIVQCLRHNSAQTFGQMIREQGLHCLSIQQFAEEGKGCFRDSLSNLYIQPAGDYRNRFPLLLSAITDQQVQADDMTYHLERLPDVLMLYADDLDALGHNPASIAAQTEEQRVLQVQDRLKQVDSAIGELVFTLKELHLWDSSYLLITTDHGMVQYHGLSSLPALKQHLVDGGFGPVYLQDENPQASNRGIRLLSTGIQCQLLFVGEPPCVEMQKSLLEHLRQLPFVDTVLDKSDLKDHGVDERFADILISPQEGYYFGYQNLPQGRLAASHDSLHEKVTHIYGLIKGPGIRKNYCEMETVSNIDFIPTLCSLMSLPQLRNTNGRVLTTIFDASSRNMRL